MSMSVEVVVLSTQSQQKNTRWIFCKQAGVLIDDFCIKNTHTAIEGYAYKAVLDCWTPVDTVDRSSVRNIAGGKTLVSFS